MGVRQWIDSLTNVLNGMVGPRHRSAFEQMSLRTQAEVENAYRGSWLVRKIHDIPPVDMTRAWRAWQTDKANIQAIEAEERRLKLRWKVRQALTLARLHGGAALILGMPGNPALPARPDSTAKGGLRYVHCVSRYQLHVSELETDPLDPNFAQPKFYTMGGGRGGSVTVHPSRVIPFVGQPLPAGALAASNEIFWGDPLLQSLADACEQSTEAQQNISDLLTEAKIDVITIPDLMSLVGTPEYEAKLMRRLTLAQSFKSIANALVVSGPAREGEPGEKWEQNQINFAGLPDLSRVFLMVAAGAADIPATRLIGQSPVGMNSTGESDLRNYYDMLSGRQESDLTPTLDPLDDALIRSALGSRPDDIFYNWRALWQLTPEQHAEVADKKSKAIKVYADSGLVPTAALAEGVQSMLIEDGLMPGLESALEKLPEDERWPEETAPTAEEMAGLGMVAAGGPTDPNAPPRRAANDADLALCDASPRTLYVRRDVLNAADIIAHFKGQGFASLLEPDAMHVTIAKSESPVDWMAVGAEWSREANGKFTVGAGGPRLVERLGPNGAVVLLFSNNELQWRHEDIKRAGATWQHDDFQLHVTLTYSAGDIDLDEVEPWRGAIELGPEIFEEVDTGWREAVAEA